MKKQFCKRGHERVPENLYGNNSCKACVRITVDRYTAEHKEEKKVYALQWRNNNKERIHKLWKINYEKNKKVRFAYSRQWRLANSAKFALYVRKSRLKSAYGLSYTAYLELLRIQNNRCAICDRQPNHTLHVDHNHKTGQIRGLLCSPCNGLLVGCLESPLRVKAEAYLARYHQNDLKAA